MPIPFNHFGVEEFCDSLSSLGISKYRADQIFSWVYSKGVRSYADMTNLPKSMREQLSSQYPIDTARIEARQVSSDGSRKYLLECSDGNFVETVGIPSDDGRLTICVSSQVGCSMGCRFCATGRNGFSRNLYPGEIVEQVLIAQDDFSMRASNIVVMGQGEPFANYENLLKALRIFNHPKLLSIGARHIAVSTCGVLNGISKFSQEPEQFTLAISLHSAIQDTRDYLIPAMKKSPLDALKEALIGYTSKTGRRFTFEYALISDINDSESDLEALIRYCNGLNCHINIITLNSVPGSDFSPSSKHTLQIWNERLLQSGIPSSIRLSRGSDISAACGQLSNEHGI